MTEIHKTRKKQPNIIEISELSEYSFSKQLNARKRSIISFLIENYSEILDNYKLIDELDIVEVVQRYNNQLKTKIKNETIIKECEMFIDLFLVQNYKNKHYKIQCTKSYIDKNNEKPQLPKYKTDVEKLKKQKRDVEKEERDKAKRRLGMMLNEEKELLKKNMDEVAIKSGYSEFSSALIDEFVDFFKDREGKLKVATLWTSAGKSHATKNLTGKAFDHYSNMLIVTPNKCNLPKQKELLEVIRKEGHDVDDDAVIMLDSVTDNITDKTECLIQLKEDIETAKPKTKYHQELIKSIETLITAVKTLNSNNNDNKEYVAFLRDKVYDAESAFREKIKSLIRNNPKTNEQIKGKSRKEKIKNLCKVSEFKTLPDIFPQLKLYNAKVIIMSAMKMLYPIDMILFSHTSLIESDILDKNSCVVLDEIDDIYVKFLDKILKDMQDSDGRMDVLLFLETVYDFISKKESLILNDVDEETLSKWNDTYFQELKGYIDQLFNSPLNLRGYTFKTEEDKNVLIYVTENQEFVSVDTDVSNNITHEFDNSSKQIRIKTTDEINNNTNELIGIINVLFNNVKDVLFKLTKEYYDYFNDKDVNVRWTYEHALSSILSHISGDTEYGKNNAKRLFQEFVSKTNFSDEKDTDTAQIIKAINESGLANNYSIYTFQNDESHKENAILYCCFNKTSPEVLLFKLITKTKKVLGLSATGFLKSKKSNFDFDKIKECEKIYYENNKYKLELLEKEKPFTVTENILNYKKAIEYQTTIVKPNSYIEILCNKTTDTVYQLAIEKIQNDFDQIIKNNIAINIESKNDFIQILRHKVDSVNVDDGGYKLIQELNQIHCILQCIINKNRTLLMIRNRNLEELSLYKLLEILKKDVFKGRTIAFKSLRDLGQKIGEDDTSDNDQSKIDIELKEFYRFNSDDNTILYILFSSIATIATGVNLYQLIKRQDVDITIDGSDINKNFYWKIPSFERFKKDTPFAENENEHNIYIKADIDAGYHENKTYLKYQFKEDKYSERLNALYELNTFVCGNKTINQEEYNNAVQKAMNCSSSLNQEKIIKESILTSEFKYLSQSLGRKERNVVGCKNKTTFIEDSTLQTESGTGFLPLLEKIDSPKYSYSNNAGTIAITQQIAEIKNKLKENAAKSAMDNISFMVDKDALNKLISSLWNEENRISKRYKEIYNYLKGEHLLTLNVTMSRQMFEQEKRKYEERFGENPSVAFDALYIRKPTGITGYTYKINGTNLLNARWDNSVYPLESDFNKKDLNTDVMNKVLQQFDAPLIHMDDNDEYIVSPIFADFVKGDIAEMVFEAIVNKMLMENHVAAHLDKYFEFFDYTTKSKHRYIDIKYWKTEKVENYIKRKEINNKLDKVTGVPEGKVLLVNMYPVQNINPEVAVVTCEGAKIQIINSIIMQNGTINKEMLNKLYDFITKE